MGNAAALHAAVRDGQLERVRELIESGAPINSKGKEGASPLHVAIEEGDEEMIQLLLDMGADKNVMTDEKWTPLYLGIYLGEVAAAKMLLDAGADVNIRCGMHKRTAVHMAAQTGRAGILRAVIERGGDVNVADANRNTPLHAAATNNTSMEAIDALAEAGANLEARDLGGCTPLHSACRQYSVEGCRTMLKHGADINALTTQLRTPLVFAACFAGTPGAAEVVEFLLNAGADETIPDDEGRVAADIVAWATDDIDALYLLEDIDLVHHLLKNAPADRAWRRRGYLVLCRAHPDRVQRGQESTDGAGAVARVLDLDEGIFRLVLSYL